MTRTPLSRSKGQGHQAALLTAAFTHQAAAVMSGDRLGGARRFGAHRRRRGVGHIVAAARLQLVKHGHPQFSLQYSDTADNAVLPSVL